MNLKNKLLVPLFLLGILCSGCDSFIYDDFEDCSQGVYLKFYSMTPCAEDSTFIGNVSSLTVFAFDETNTLIRTVTKENVNLSSDYELLMPVSDGYFSFIAWAGVDSRFEQSAFKIGSTTKDAVMASLNSKEKLAADLNGAHVWQGQSDDAVFLPDPDEFGEVYKHTAVNLREKTNRVKVIVEFDSSVTELTPKDLTVSLTAANGTFLIDGSMPLNNPILTYPLLNTAYTDNRVAWDFTLLELLTGYHNKLTITYPKTGEKVFDGDLLASILLNTLEGGVNLACENDFTVKFLVKDYCAECGANSIDPKLNNAFTCAVYVNDWLVHSYDTELGL